MSGSWSPGDQGFLNAVAGALGSVVTINPVAANQALTVSPGGSPFNVTLTQNTTLSIAGAMAGVACSVPVVLTQDATGGRIVTWWPGITWLPGSAPSLPQGPGTSLLCSLVSLDGGATWYGSYGGSASIEPWRVVNALGQPAFQNTWASPVGTYAPLQFAKTASGLVLIEGAISNATAANNNTVVFTLPVGYRPLATLRHIDYAYNGAADQTSRWVIFANGNVQAGSSATPLNEVHSLIVFRAEQ